MVSQDLINRLQQLTEGLIWMSEADAPFEFFVWERPETEALPPQELLHHLGYALDTPVEVQSLEQFFTPVLQQDWRDEAETRQYQALMAYLKDHLRDIQVYRIGEVEIDVYILGQTAEGNVAGIKTKVVQT